MGWQGITDGRDRVNVTADHTLAVRQTESSAPLVLVPLHQTIASTTLATPATIDEYTTTVTDATGFAIGQLLALSDPDTQQVYFGEIIGVSGTTITVDRPFDFTFTAGKLATANRTNMNVNGATTTQVFGLRQGLDPGIAFTVDLHRMMLTLMTATACDLSTFGDIAGGITNGCTFRRRDGNRVNIANIKTNLDIASHAYDMQIYAATNPAQGQDGVTSRLSFNKFGGVVRIASDEDYEVLINDNLSTLTKFILVVQGIINTEV